MKTKQRTIKQLLEICIEYWDSERILKLDSPYNKRGLCFLISSLHRNEIITKDEYIEMSNLFDNNRPSELKHSHFFDVNHMFYSYWWNIDYKEVRLRFLKHLLTLENN